MEGQVSNNSEYRALSLPNIIIFLVIAYFFVEVIVTWDSFEGCSKPVHIWLLVTIFLISILRGLMISMETTQSGHIFKFTALTILFGFFPLFLTWTVIGTSWYADAHKYTPQCLVENSQWILIFWMSISYFLMFTYIATVLTLFIEKFIDSGDGFENPENAEQNMRRLQQNQGLNSEERNLIEQRNYDSWLQGKLDESNTTFVNKLNDSFFSERSELDQAYRRTQIAQSASSLGLRDTACTRIDSQRQTPDLDFLCAICYLNFDQGEQIKVMPGCKHNFHKDCIDQWLKMKARCPMCNQDTRSVLSSDSRRL